MGNTTHTGTDSLVDGDAVTEMALALNRYMLRSPSARAAYLATWGVEWIALPTVDGDDFFPSAIEAGSYGVVSDSTTAKTSLARGSHS